MECIGSGGKQKGSDTKSNISTIGVGYVFIKQVGARYGKAGVDAKMQGEGMDKSGGGR